jgi:hypothetical protein
MSARTQTSILTWVIKTPEGKQLATCETHSAAIRQIEEREVQPDVYPDWHNDLHIVCAVVPDGPLPPLRHFGHDLGLGDDGKPSIRFVDSTSYDLAE